MPVIRNLGGRRSDDRSDRVPQVWFEPCRFTDIVAGVDGDFADGQSAFTTAYSDFASAELGLGLSALFSDTVYCDLLGADLVSIVPLEELILGSVASF